MYCGLPKFEDKMPFLLVVSQFSFVNVFCNNGKQLQGDVPILLTFNNIVNVYMSVEAVHYYTSVM